MPCGIRTALALFVLGFLLGAFAQAQYQGGMTQ